MIENSFEHAFGNNRRGGSLWVRIRYELARLQIIVEDDGDSLSDEMLHSLREKMDYPDRVQEKTGMINSCMRLRLKYGEESGVSVSRSEFGGLKTVIVIETVKGGESHVPNDDR